jgi:hypothetical protein
MPPPSACFSINKAINGLPDADKLVELATSHLNAEMSRFVVPESLRGLGMDDRLEIAFLPSNV